MMNHLKYQSMVVEDHVEIHHEFSMYNKDIEHPFEPIPNVFAIAPPEGEIQD
jgi:hypothetical protein